MMTTPLVYLLSALWVHQCPNAQLVRFLFPFHGIYHKDQLAESIEQVRRKRIYA